MNTLLGRELKALTQRQQLSMSNWRAIAELIYTEGLMSIDILSFLAYEVQHYRRKHVITRLLARYNSLLAKEVAVQFYTEVLEWPQRGTLKHIYETKSSSEEA